MLNCPSQSYNQFEPFNHQVQQGPLFQLCSTTFHNRRTLHARIGKSTPDIYKILCELTVARIEDQISFTVSILDDPWPIILVMLIRDSIAPGIIWNNIHHIHHPKSILNCINIVFYRDYGWKWGIPKSPLDHSGHSDWMGITIRHPSPRRTFCHTSRKTWLWFFRPGFVTLI